MKKYPVILFDLDGTLTDPAEGITNSIQYALKKFGIEVTDKKELYKFIGPPLKDAYKEYYGFTPQQCADGIIYFREYFEKKGWKENKPIEGIPEMLQTLKEMGKRLMIATSKPEKFARKIAEHFGMAKYFEFIGGATIDESRVDKAEVINYVLENCGITDKKSVLMVGDRKHDIIGAKKAGVDGAGVLFGYGNLQELETAGAIFVAKSVAELTDYVV